MPAGHLKFTGLNLVFHNTIAFKISLPIAVYEDDFRTTATAVIFENDPVLSLPTGLLATDVPVIMRCARNNVNCRDFCCSSGRVRETPNYTKTTARYRHSGRNRRRIASLIYRRASGVALRELAKRPAVGPSPAIGFLFYLFLCARETVYIRIKCHAYADALCGGVSCSHGT